MGLFFGILRRDASISTAANVVRALTRILCTIAIAWQAGLEGVALFTLLVTVETLTVSSISSLFSGPAAVLGPGRHRRLREGINSYAEGFQAWLALGLAASWVLGAGITDLDPQVSFAFALSLLSTVPYLARRSTRIIEFDSGRVLVSDSLICALVLISPRIAAHLELDILVTFWMVNGLAQGLAWFILPRPGRAIHSVRLRRKIRGKVLGTGIKMLAGSVSLSISGRSQPFVIGVLFGAPSVGIYGCANAFGAPIRLASMSVRSVILPRLALKHRSGDEPVRVGRRLLLIGLLAVFCGVAMSAWLARPAVQMVFGDEFLDAAAYVPWLVVYALLGVLSSVASMAVQARGQSGLCAAIRAVGAVIAIPAMWLGGLVAGLLGLIAALMLIELLALIMFMAWPQPIRCESRIQTVPVNLPRRTFSILGLQQGHRARNLV